MRHLLVCTALLSWSALSEAQVASPSIDKKVDALIEEEAQLAGRG